MTTDELIAMARKAGFVLADNATAESLNRFRAFAALVAAQEREACAQVCATEEARALYNFDNDLESNRPFWNGGSQIATSCEASIRERGKP